MPSLIDYYRAATGDNVTPEDLLIELLLADQALCRGEISGEEYSALVDRAEQQLRPREAEDAR